MSGGASDAGVDDVGAFDVCGRLPTGTTVLEASAGTGKTYTVGALVTRFVAEGHATLDQLLVVTFGRAASQELRERVRGQLVSAERALADPTAARGSSDRLVAMLATGPDDEVAVRRRRLATALADFDAATIATTHQFCQQVLTGLGVAGDSEPGATLVDDIDELVVEVVDDLYVARFAAAAAPSPPFSRAVALDLARRAVDDPQARLEPRSAEPGSEADWRFRFASAVRAEVDRRKRRRRLLSYDDLLTLLADALRGDDAPARERMRARWKVVLVDEFQDTDPVQWQVLERAFAGHATLVLVGDPKQAIYAFRGGDVVTYLRAAETAGARATLPTSYRSDAVLGSALHALLGGAALGDPGIVVRRIESAHAGSRLAGAPAPAPVRLRVVTRSQLGVRGAAKIGIDAARAAIADDLAADVARLLAAGARFDGAPLVAGDVAVLVGRHKQATLVRNCLAAKGIPAVVAGAGSVFGTSAGDDWMVLLEALEQPHRSGRVRAAALTPFLGRTADELALGGETLTDELGALVRGWADLLSARGVAALLEVATAEQGMPARLLRLRDGERRLTDLRHVGESLHTAAVRDGLGLAALVEWLRERRAEAEGDAGAERSRRLDSDAAAVQVVTLHASKGLQYPVVYLPFAFDRWTPDDPGMMRLHDEAGDRVLDVGGRGSPGRPERESRWADEEAGESLRLLYVGLTRAQSQVVAWWAPTRTTTASGLHRLLFGREPGAAAVPDNVAVPSDENVAKRLAELEASGAVSVESAVPAPAPAAADRAPEVLSLMVGQFDRVLDTAWRRTSYTALTSVETSGVAGDVGSEPETGERDDEVVEVAPDEPPGTVPSRAAGGETGPDAVAEEPDDDVLRAVDSPMAELPMGASFGTLVHAVLETVDPQADDLAAELRSRAAEQLARRPFSGLDAEGLSRSLEPVLATPLGHLADRMTLADVGIRDRLTELDFELPLAGGDQPRGDATLGHVADLLVDLLPAGDPLAGYAARLRAPELARQSLRGYLTGSLDVVLRLPGPRYVVADYKTNWLGEPGEPLTAWHYRPEALQRAMTHSHYPLQALLYCVALHRFLRWRQPGYDPRAHLGGVLYLYVRGMCGPATPLVEGQPCGVFGWQPPAELVEALSDLLDMRAAA